MYVNHTYTVAVPLKINQSNSVSINVRELMGWVRNVVLIKCIFGSGKPKGGRDFGWEGTRAR
jgi:hypothetical protein